MPGAHARKSLPLNEDDLRDLAALRESSTRREALGSLAAVPVPPDSSDAHLLHAVWTAGIKAIEHQLEEEGYAALAADRADREQQRSTRDRRRPHWADEK